MSAEADAKLDPRLQRVARAVGDPARRANEVRNTSIGLRAAVDAADPAALTVEVLVRVAGAPPVDALGGTRWSRVTEDIYAVEVPVAALGELVALSEVRYVEAPHTLVPDGDDDAAPDGGAVRALAAAALPAGGRGLTGAGVVVGIIDFGLDFTLDDFVDGEGNSRVAFLWDQTLVPRDGERSPPEFAQGVEYDAAAITAALKLDDPFTAVRHRPANASHGTHVAGIAAGNGRSTDAAFPAGVHIGVAPEATIVFVQPGLDASAPSLTHSPQVAKAIAYIYARADALGMPCVINMSLSQNGGGHDGQSLVERVIDHHLEARDGRGFVNAAGNRHTRSGHAAGVLAAGTVHTLRWHSGAGASAQPDPTPNELEVWYSPRDRVEARLISPAGEPTPAVAPSGSVEHHFASGNTATIISERFSSLNGDARVYVAVEPADNGAVEPGEWRLELTPKTVRDGRFHAWIERDDARLANQSSFAPADFVPAATLGTPATSRWVISVANYDHRTTAVHPASSRGRTRDGRDKPEVAAPGTDILAAGALGGRPDGAGGTFPVRVAKTGTSMAAPYVAGVVALLLQRRPSLSAAQLRAVVAASADPAPGVDGFDIAWGYGRIDPAAAGSLP